MPSWARRLGESPRAEAAAAAEDLACPGSEADRLGERAARAKAAESSPHMIADRGVGEGALRGEILGLNHGRWCGWRQARHLRAIEALWQRF